MDKILLIVVLALLCFGVAVVYTASNAQARVMGFDAEHYMISHLGRAAFFAVIMLALSRVDYGYWKFLGRIAFFVFFFLSLVALIKGGEVKGANRWILGIQPSEFMKFGLFAWICAKLSEAGDNIKTPLCTLIQPGVPYALCALILLRQPNYSMFLMVSAVVLCVMIVAGVNFKYLGMVAAVGLPIVGAILMLSTHSRARILALFASDGDMQASQYQTMHSLQALGNGGWFGTGYGNGLEKLGYLPEAHKDVVFAVIGEEFGFIITLLLLLCFMILFARGFRIAQNSSTRFGRYLALALTLSLFANFAVHVMVCVGLIPMTGQPLPFLSYGGTNLGFSCLAAGILLNISRPTSGRKINEPYTSGSSLESSVFRNYDYARSSL